MVATIVTLTLAFCYLIGFAVLRAGINEIRTGFATRRWPTTDAVLERCVVDSRRTSNSRVHEVSVKYTYSLAGKRYTGENYAIGYLASSFRHTHERARQRVLDMDRFVVRYDPAQPGISAIFPSTNTQIFWTFGFSLFWLGMTHVFALIALSASGVGDAVRTWFASLIA